jgi:HPt (histidine-containing phosphotransfer) domain-containing protein
MAALEAAPAQLVITDWMMPGESGRVLLRKLAARPELRGQARLVVFSAGLDAEVLALLPELGVWRMLGKPVTVRAMEDCVTEALGLQALLPSAALAAAELPARRGLDDAQVRAIAINFAGDVALFHAFKADCVQQLEGDLRAGAAALAAADAAALRRLAHNLKSVLRSLGLEASAVTAQGLEKACIDADWEAITEQWPAFATACLLMSQTQTETQTDLPTGPPSA